MTDFTENDKRYSLEEIEKTYDRLNCRSQGWTPTFAELKEELTHPKTEFSEGQVVICEGPNHYGYYMVGRQSDKATEGTFIEQARALTLEEVGPDFVLKADVMPLVEALRPMTKLWKSEYGVSTVAEYNAMAEKIIEALDNLSDSLKGESPKKEASLHDTSAVTLCGVRGCNNLATHTWSGHPTCDDCGTPGRKVNHE